MSETLGLGWVGGWTTPGVVTANEVIITGPNGGEFVYDNNNHLRSANVGATTTDPVQGITCQQGFSLFNGFGAVIQLESTSAAAPGFFQYVDTNSASQGALAYSSAPRAVTEPITSVAVPQGVELWNSTLTVTGFPTTRKGNIGIANLAPFTGFMSFTNSTGYEFDKGLVVPSIVAFAPGGLSSAEGWHTITLDAGWTGSGRYKLLAQANMVYVDLAATHAAFTVATNLNNSNPIPAAYQPLSAKNIGAPGIPNRAGAEITGGVFVAEPNGVSCTECDIQGIYPLD